MDCLNVEELLASSDDEPSLLGEKEDNSKDLDEDILEANQQGVIDEKNNAVKEDILEELASFIEVIDKGSDGTSSTVTKSAKSEDDAQLKNTDTNGHVSKVESSDEEKISKSNDSILSTADSIDGQGNLVNHSTPMRSSKASLTSTEELDFSLLEDDDDDDEYLTVTLDQLELDYSLLEEKEEEEEDEESTLIHDDTVIESNTTAADIKAEPGALSNVKSSNGQTKTENVDEDLEPPQKKAKLPPKKSAKKPKAITKYDVKQMYLQTAKKIWETNTPKSMRHYLHSWHPNLRDFEEPRVHRSAQKNKSTAFESVLEWSDKHHPAWQAYREVPSSNHAEFIHSQWGTNNYIDITRNLTKFSKRGGVKVERKPMPIPKKIQPPTDDDGIEDNNLVTVMANHAKKTAEEYEKIKPIEDEDTGNNGLQAALKNLETSVVGCRFCSFRCHCSPGKKFKKSFENGIPFDDPDVKNERFLNLGNYEVKQEIRGAINTLMHEKPPQELDQFRNRYLNSATNMIASAEELYHFYKEYDNGMNSVRLSVEQVRELSSVEVTQDRFHETYNSPYAGFGLSDDEDDHIVNVTNDEVGSEADSDEGQKLEDIKDNLKEEK